MPAMDPTTQPQRKAEVSKISLSTEQSEMYLTVGGQVLEAEEAEAEAGAEDGEDAGEEEASGRCLCLQPQDVLISYLRITNRIGNVLNLVPAQLTFVS